LQNQIVKVVHVLATVLKSMRNYRAPVRRPKTLVEAVLAEQFVSCEVLIDLVVIDRVACFVVQREGLVVGGDDFRVSYGRQINLRDVER
jgi:hypothetical protein